MRASWLLVKSELCRAFLIIVISLFALSPTLAQDATATPQADSAPLDAPSRVDIQPVARDEEIEVRLQDILLATTWFMEPDVRVQEGVVFITGQAQTSEYKTWAGDLARNTQDVVAVVNQMEVIEPPILNFDPIVSGVRDLGRAVLRAVPLVVFGIFIMILSWVVSRAATQVSRRYLERRNINILLRNVISRSVGVLLFLFGLYVVFQVAGLTNIALTILGGTGLLGIILGIAFRDITENFLASIFLSVQNPFSVGDLVEIEGVIGYIQRMTTRTTIIMTLAGNHVQIPNATVYQSVIHNFTSNPNRQIDFTIGVGYEDSISLAQETIQRVLQDHPAVLNDPENLVLVDSLGSATVNLQIYFWIDGTQHSWLKVKSSVIRLVKRAIQDVGISMPDEAREMIFPQGVPVKIIQGEQSAVDYPVQMPRIPTQPPLEDDTVSTSAEGGLRSEAREIEQQAKKSRSPESGENLLSPETSTTTE
ncbi:MAG: mechanosensitive ion channel protein MscS [Anaerolineaceae bacterium]|nr:mechanosensitive ion channel protein MscS [Anaerolineaceae bacterium]